MISYGDRPNDYDSVSTCNRLFYRTWRCLTLSLLDFRHKFGVIHQSYTPNKEREFYSTFNSTALTISVDNLLTSSPHCCYRYKKDHRYYLFRYVEIWSCYTSTLIPFDISARYDHQRKLAKYEARLIKHHFRNCFITSGLKSYPLFFVCSCCN
jgi:hypothetical protein